MMKNLSIIYIIIFFLFSKNLFARPLIADLSLREIAIDSGFTGTDIILYGARNDAGDVVIVVRGPDKNFIVRKKEPVYFVWMNKKSVIYKNVSGFYTIAANRDLSNIKNQYLLDHLDIGLENLNIQSLDNENEKNANFTSALISDKIDRHLYHPKIQDLSFTGDTLFRAKIHFPENIPLGIYTAEFYLFGDGELKGLQTTPIRVYKKGFDAFIYDFANNNKLMYGIFAVMLALLSGWVAGVIFRKV